MALTFGPAKSLDDITLDDVLANPIWLWVWETGGEAKIGQDETWQQPVLGTTDVTDEMSEPVISFRVKGSNIIGFGSYRPKDDRLFGMALWIDNEWRMLKKTGLSVPLVLVAIPSINGLRGVEFSCIDFA